MKPYVCQKHGQVAAYINVHKNGRTNRNCKTCASDHSTKQRLSMDPKGRREAARLHYARLRSAILDAYGNACACCAESIPEFLELNHIHGGGNKHHKLVGNGAVYREVRRLGFPKDRYNLLCSNCNKASWRSGCPHERGVRDSIIYDLNRPIRIVAA